MNRNTATYLPLVVVAFWAVAIAAPPIMQSLARKPGPEQQAAAGMAPIISCINNGERSWKVALAAYLDQYQSSLGPPPRSALQHPFSDKLMGGMGLSEAGFQRCSADLGAEIRALGTYPPLTALATRYTADMEALKELNERIDNLYMLGSGSEPTAEQHNLHERLLVAAKELFKTSQALQTSLEYYDTHLRPLQLARLVEHHTPDQHWQTLNFMLQARLAIDKLDSEAQQRTLRPWQLQLIDEQLHVAWKDGNAYMAMYPRLVGAQKGPDQRTLWAKINGHAEAETFLAAVDKLSLDWRAQAEPTVLSADYQHLGDAYDVMLDQYNIGAAAY